MALELVLQVGDGMLASTDCRTAGLGDAGVPGRQRQPHHRYRGNRIRAMALNLEEDNVGAVIMGPDTGIREGTTVRRTGELISVPIGPALIGRVVNAVGDPTLARVLVATGAMAD